MCTRVPPGLLRVLTVLIWCSSAVARGDDAGFRQEVESDWARQEARLGRNPGDSRAIADALTRAERLHAALAAMPGAAEREQTAQTLARFRAGGNLDGRSEAERRARYHDIRWLARDLALSNPLIAGKRILFMERRRFICQMLHEYLGYYYDYGDIEGGGIYVLEEPGASERVTDLLGGAFPRGNYTTLSLSYDAQTIYFAFAPRAEEKPDFYSPDRRCFHIYAMDAGGGHLRQLTDGSDDDFDPCPLPDGGIAFMSTMRGGFTRCNNPWEPLPAHTLHRMEADGRNVRTLSFHETSEWHPQVLANGQIAYIRWDYVDRSAAHFHGIWTTNPDGTNARQLFGSYTQNVNACYQPHSIPGSHRVAFLAGAHHANVGGSLVLLEPSRTALDPATGEDSFASLERLTPEVCFPETAEGWPSSYYHSPWPLSEDFFLVAFSFDPLPGMGPKVEEDTKTGLYLYDRFGNLELLYRKDGISSMYPIPLAPRPTPPVIASSLDPSLGDEGEYLLANVRQSHFPLPESRPVRELRIYQILPKSETHVANKPRIGYANAESARMLLGTVPVEEDGSAYFRAPAGKPLAFQAVDAGGRAVQGMRSATYLQPGERRSCVGCHETTSAVESGQRLLAAMRAPSTIAPGPDGTRPWSFPRLIQPILDQHCIRCHGEGMTPPVLTGAPAGAFTAAYESLRAYARWYEWGDATIRPIVTQPGEMPSDMSPLVGVLADEHHAGELSLPDEDLRRIYLWLDGNGSFYGSYSRREQLAQHRGEAIPPPALH